MESREKSSFKTANWAVKGENGQELFAKGGSFRAKISLRERVSITGSEGRIQEATRPQEATPDSIADQNGPFFDPDGVGFNVTIRG